MEQMGGGGGGGLGNMERRWGGGGGGRIYMKDEEGMESRKNEGGEVSVHLLFLTLMNLEFTIPVPTG